jgi:hypothetical protein
MRGPGGKSGQPDPTFGEGKPSLRENIHLKSDKFNRAEALRPDNNVRILCHRRLPESNRDFPLASCLPARAAADPLLARALDMNAGRNGAERPSLDDFFIKKPAFALMNETRNGFRSLEGLRQPSGWRGRAIGRASVERGGVMASRFALSLYALSTWIVPLVVAITFHEAAHGFVARLLGDNTAWLRGRVTFNPLKHIDSFGTILLPALLMLMHSPFLFGYAKPVPVNFGALKRPKRDSVFVAAAGPAMNFALAILSAAFIHLAAILPPGAADWTAANLNNALIINVLLAVFNLIPDSAARRRPHPGRAFAPGAVARARLARALWNDHPHRRARHPAGARRRGGNRSQLPMAVRGEADRRDHPNNPVAHGSELARFSIALNRHCDDAERSEDRRAAAGGPRIASRRRRMTMARIDSLLFPAFASSPGARQ